MKIEINTINNQGDHTQEFVELKVSQATNLMNYLLSDTTYVDDTTVSNKLPHTYWFSSTEVKAGDFVRLHTKGGSSSSNTNQAGTTTHQIYWGLSTAVWNNTGDKAILFEISDRTSKKAK
jgi:hypothetical protein